MAGNDFFFHIVDGKLVKTALSGQLIECYLIPVESVKNCKIIHYDLANGLVFIRHDPTRLYVLLLYSLNYLSIATNNFISDMQMLQFDVKTKSFINSEVKDHGTEPFETLDCYMHYSDEGNFLIGNNGKMIIYCNQYLSKGLVSCS